MEKSKGRILIILIYRYAPFVGYFTIAMNDYPQLKFLVLLGMALMVMTSKDPQAWYISIKEFNTIIFSYQYFYTNFLNYFKNFFK